MGQSREEIDAPQTTMGQPNPEWIRGTCPLCANYLVSHLYYVAQKGYLVIWECWGTHAAPPTCDYKKVL